MSVRPVGSGTLGTKTEIKNLNSFRFLEEAIAAEVERQIVALGAGERIVQETRLWDAAARETVSMRSKEEAHDYRYFPEPDLPPLVVGAERLQALGDAMPALPAARRRMLQELHGLSESDAVTLTLHGLDGYFEDVGPRRRRSQGREELAARRRARGDERPRHRLGRGRSRSASRPRAWRDCWRSSSRGASAARSRRTCS